MPAVPLSEIEAAATRIAAYVRRTPLLPFDFLNAKSGGSVLLKAEMLQRTGSFKIRGAANCILSQFDRAKKAGVVAASAGNHAQGVAMMAGLLEIPATIVMPRLTPPIKVQNTQRYGATVELVGNVYDDSYEHAKKLADERGYLFIHPFCDPLVIAGQGTLGLELCDDPQFADTEAVVIPIGGGGLASGVAAALRARRPDVKIYGVTPRNAASMWSSFKRGEVVIEEVKYTLAEGTATKRPEPKMLGYLRDSLDDVFSLSEESIASAIAVLAEHGKLVTEGSGALALAALMEGLVPEKHVALVLSGGNIDVPAFSHVLQRGMVAQGRRVRLVIRLQDRPGGLLAITQILAEQGGNIQQVFHQRAALQTAMGEAEVEVELETRGPEHTEAIVKAFKDRGFSIHRA